MSSKARRIVDRAARSSAFHWEQIAGSRRAARMAAPEHAGADRRRSITATRTQQAHLAALERDAFAKGYAQGERAGVEAAAQRGDAMLRRLTQTLEELAALRAQMIRQTERQMVQLALAAGPARSCTARSRSTRTCWSRWRASRSTGSATSARRDHAPPSRRLQRHRRRPRPTHGPAAHVTVVADPRVPRGGCRIESRLRRRRRRHRRAAAGARARAARRRRRRRAPCHASAESALAAAATSTPSARLDTMPLAGRVVAHRRSAHRVGRARARASAKSAKSDASAGGAAAGAKSSASATARCSRCRSARRRGHPSRRPRRRARRRDLGRRRRRAARARRRRARPAARRRPAAHRRARCPLQPPPLNPLAARRRSRRRSAPACAPSTRC